MTQGEEWSNLMRAPWGQFTPKAVAAKAQAQADYEKATKAFWAKRKMPVPTV